MVFPDYKIVMIITRGSLLAQFTRRSFFSFSSSGSQEDNHFGFTNVTTDKKQPLVNQVFHSVANKYDIMNDFMSMGVHRYWKHCFVNELGCLTPNRVYTHHQKPPAVRVLDVAGGTGDIAFRILDNHSRKSTR